MSHKLKLTATGLQRLRWNDGLRELHKFVRQSDGSVIVTLKGTGEEVSRYSSAEEAEQIYWEDTPHPDSWIPFLRDDLEIEAGVTVENFVDAVRQHDELAYIAEMWFDDWGGVEVDGPVKLHRRLLLEETLGEVYGFTEGVGESLLHVDQQIELVGETTQSFDYQMTLLEVMQSLFGSSEKEVHFVSEFGALTLRDSYGETADPLESLLAYVDVHDSLTVNDLLQWVASDPELTEFIGAYSWCSHIDQFHTEGNLPPEAADLDSEPLHRAEIVRHIEIAQYRQSKPWISDWVDFVCWGGPTKSTIEMCQPKYVVTYDTPKNKGNVRVFSQDDGAVSPESARKAFESWAERVGVRVVEIVNIRFEAGSECPKEERYGVGFSPVYHYSHLPLELTTKCKIRKQAILSRKGRVLESARDEWEGEVRHTLLDILDAIYWEISFYGPPESRDDEREKLSDMVAEIDQWSENPDDRKMKTFVSFEDMMSYDKDNDPDGPYDSYTLDFGFGEEE